MIRRSKMRYDRIQRTGWQQSKDTLKLKMRKHEIWRSKKLSKTYHDIRGENTRYGECKEERNSSSGYRNCFEACNFSSECHYWSGDGFSQDDFLWGCPRLADDNRGCSCKHGFCFFSGGNPEGYPKIPDEYRCSVYNDCECRWIAVWKKSYINY